MNKNLEESLLRAANELITQLRQETQRMDVRIKSVVVRMVERKETRDNGKDKPVTYRQRGFMAHAVIEKHVVNVHWEEPGLI